MRPMRPLHGNMAAAMLVGAALLAPASGAAQERAPDRFAGTGPPGPFTAATLPDPPSAAHAAFDTRTPGRRAGAVFLGALGGVAAEAEAVAPPDARRGRAEARSSAGGA